VQQGKVNRPFVAAHSETAHQSARKQHVLRADEDHVLVRVLDPGIEITLAAHQHMDRHLAAAMCTIDTQTV